MELLTAKDIMALLGVGRTTAERYIRESGLELPRVKGSPHRVPKDAFMAWIGGKK